VRETKNIKKKYKDKISTGDSPWKTAGAHFLNFHVGSENWLSLRQLPFMHSDIAGIPSVSRFSNRAENYVRYRPSYPLEILPFLERTLGLHKGQQIADIGSGTGIFSELFLRNGYAVTGIEPNEQMRIAAERKLAYFEGFTSLAGRGEDTGLPSRTIDLITVAQAFHWLDPAAAKKEFLRILKPEGSIVLAWNLRLHHTDFLREYELLKQRFGINYLGDKMVDEDCIAAFFEPLPVSSFRFPNVQFLDFEGLKGQLLSASYIPLPGYPTYDDMISELVRLFVKYHQGGLIKMEFETKLYLHVPC
jgi:SAM-dependent methyltransferase